MSKTENIPVTNWCQKQKIFLTLRPQCICLPGLNVLCGDIQVRCGTCKVEAEGRVNLRKHTATNTSDDVMMNVNLLPLCGIYVFTDKNGVVSLLLLLFRSTGVSTQIAKLMGSTWGPPGSCRPQIWPMLAPWTLQSPWCSLPLLKHLSCRIVFLSSVCLPIAWLWHY